MFALFDGVEHGVDLQGPIVEVVVDSEFGESNAVVGEKESIRELIVGEIWRIGVG